VVLLLQEVHATPWRMHVLQLGRLVAPGDFMALLLFSYCEK